MLTSDLVRVLQKKGRIAPRTLKHEDRARLAATAGALVSTYKAMVGSTRAELDEAASAIPVGARERVVVAGLRKLCDDRTELELESPIDPLRVRQEAFSLAALGHRSAEGFDRAKVIEEVARRLETSADAVEKALFADLHDAQVVRSFDAPTVPELFDRYDLALVQALLFRATKLVLSFRDPRPVVVRDLFRAARFHGLLHTIERGGAKRDFVVTFDGPFSLFDSVQKYGARLAMFLPTALCLESFELRAELVWGKSRTPVELVLDQTSGLVAPKERRTFVRPEVEALKTAFAALGSEWTASDNDRIVVSKDKVALVPDLVFENAETGEEVFLEVFGFWSRAAVWRRVEQIQAGLPARLIMAVSKQARVSEEALGDDEGGSSLYVFKTAISAKEILARLRLKA